MTYYYKTLLLMVLFSPSLFAGGCVSVPRTPKELRTVHQRKQVQTLAIVAGTCDNLARQRCNDAKKHAPTRRAEDADAHLQKAREYAHVAGELRTAIYALAEQATQQ